MAAVKQQVLNWLYSVLTGVRTLHKTALPGYHPSKEATDLPYSNIMM